MLMLEYTVIFCAMMCHIFYERCRSPPTIVLFLLSKALHLLLCSCTVLMPFHRFQVAQSLHADVTHVVVDPDDKSRYASLRARIRCDSAMTLFSSYAEGIYTERN